MDFVIDVVGTGDGHYTVPQQPSLLQVQAFISKVGLFCISYVNLADGLNNKRGSKHSTSSSVAMRPHAFKLFVTWKLHTEHT
jgi:hypothetical protein